MLTVSSKALLAMSESMAESAKQNLSVWCVLGQTDRYDAAMHRANEVKRAARTVQLYDRRQILKNVGIAV